LEKQCLDDSVPLKYHYVLDQIKQQLSRDTIIVNEGANTMDFGRIILPTYEPRSRLDAGTMGTMGVGIGYSIAAALIFPDRKVVAVEGDSAFGFSGMEVEVACRLGLPITFIILNNNGIYSGLEEITDRNNLPATALSPNSRYEKIIEAFGGKGYFATKPDEIKSSLKEALKEKVPTLINIMIDTHGPTPKIVQANKTH